MPPKIVRKISSSSNERGTSNTRRLTQAEEAEQGQIPPSSMMATQTQTSGYPAATAAYLIPGRIQLPPILPSPTASADPRLLPLSNSISPLASEQVTSARSNSPYTPSGNRPPPYSYFYTQDRPQSGHATPISPAGSNQNLRTTHPEPLIPQKRQHETVMESPYGPPPPLSILTPASNPPQVAHPRTILPPLSAHSSVSNASTPTGTTASFPLLSHLSPFSRPPSEISSNSIKSRCSLHIRQQPRAARAGPDGKDRRNVDPPPVLQLLLTDFSPDSQADLSELKSNHYVVHCKLISAESPRRDVTTQTTVSEDGSRETSRLLLGTNVASPFFCADDPDVETMPQHPQSGDLVPQDPPSPSTRFFQTSSRRSASPPSAPTNPPPTTLPGAFFIFADLSIRRAGLYRFEFTLMKIDPSSRHLPLIAVVASSKFKVVNAKDFDQVHPSTNLVKGLLERGAPFPLKLKKGIREGQRRRPAGAEGEVGSIEGSNDGDLPGAEGGGDDDDDDEQEGEN